MIQETVLGLEEHQKPELAAEALQLQKRQRLNSQHLKQRCMGKHPVGARFFMLGMQLLVLGGASFLKMKLVAKWAQMLTPETIIKLMVACRGTDRHRIQGQSLGEDRYLWRKTVLVDRHTGEVRETGPAEEWVRLPRLKQIRKTGPAKISLTLFGYKEDGASVSHSPVPISDWKSDEG